MTYQGAIDELKSLENNSSMPDWFKPTIKKVRETMEMDGRENITGEWIVFSGGYVCSKCRKDRKIKVKNVASHYCPDCGADMRGKA